MVCSKCHSEVLPDSKCCTHCGNVLNISESTENTGISNSNEDNYFTRTYLQDFKQKPAGKTKKLALLIISVVIGFSIITAPIMYLLYNNVYLFNKQVSSVIKEVEKKNFKKAKSNYDSLKAQLKDSKKNRAIVTIDDVLNKKADSLSQDYIKSKLDYDELEVWFNGLNQFPSVKEKITEKEKVLKKYKDSRQSMKSADKAMKDKEYLDALKYYKEVVREDSSNYSKAQNNIKTCIKDMYDYYINEAEQMNSKGYYEDAYKTVKSIKEYYPDDPIIKSKMDTYLNNLFDATIKKADELNAGKKFDNAISTLESLKAYFPNNQKIAEKVSLYKKNKIAAALAEQEKVEKRKKELLAQTSQRYDKEYGMKVYSPKGLDTYYVNIDDKLNIEPRMYTLADSSAGLMFFIGYAQDEYINFSKLIFDIDGEIIEQEIPESVKKSEFYNPGVAEWCTLSAINNSKLVEQIKKLAYGTNSKIIFEGNKYRNHVLTKKEKDNLKLFIELFGYYNQVNESMISDDSPGQST